MVIPIQSRIGGMAFSKASTAAPVASTDPAQVCFSWSGSSFECSPLSNPSAPPPTPAESLMDWYTRESSISSECCMDAACAFPSWPNRPSLSSADSTESTDSYSNAFLSDEDLLWMPENAGVELPLEEDPKKPEVVCSLTMEEQLARMRAIAEQEDRARFLAKVEAHARATQALQRAKMAHERPSTKPKKRRVMTPKRRAHSSTAKVTSS